MTISLKCLLRTIFDLKGYDILSPDYSAAAIHAQLLQSLSILLLFGEKSTSAAAESDQSMYALRLSLLAILLFEPADERLLVDFEVVVVIVVKFVHFLGGAMGIVPDEGLRLVELTILWERLGRMGIGGVRRIPLMG